MRRGERAGAPTGAVGATWPSSRGSGAGERGDAAGNAVDRRRRRGLLRERRGGEPSVGAVRRVVAGQGGAASDRVSSCMLHLSTFRSLATFDLRVSAMRARA